MSDVARARSGSAAPAGDSDTRPAPESEPRRAELSGGIAPSSNPTPTPTPTPAPVSPSATAAGTLLAGRYRLRTRVGSDTAAGAEFWRAEDTVLQRDVAVTVLRRLAQDSGGPDDPTGASRAGEMVVRALRSGSFEHDGCARLLDVLAPEGSRIPPDVLGAAVTEWVPGRSLAELVTEGLIRPLAAARALVPLAAAAEEAHRHGLVLGCDHPQRIRITPDGRAQLCFVLPRPEVAPADDVRGLGAILYTLLTSRWPLARTDAARAGLATADYTARGTPVAPSRLRPGVPLELDTLVQGTLGPADALGHVRTAAAVHLLLSEVVAEDDRIAVLPPTHDGVPSSPGDVWQDGDRPPPPADPARRRNLSIGLVALAVATLVVLGYLGMQLTSAFSSGSRPAIVVASSAPVPPGNTAAGPGEDDPPLPPPGGTGGPAAAAGVEVYDNSGDRDNAGRVSRVIDGSPTSGWNTFTYKQQFPALKPGVGIMVSFASAVQLSELTITSPSPGTVVQIRSAPSAEAAFPDTTQLSEVTLGAGPTPVSLAGSQPVTHVLVWITRLGGDDGANRTEINELQFRRAG
ncbi:MAG TPA: protein kinase family protein [Pseudonocardia sp.]|nr:protein kinase family protein [Pseudonocardia sp.]